MSEKEQITSVFFGVMSADLLDSDGAKRYNEAKSAAAFAKSVANKLGRRYRGAEIDYRIVSGISGSTPHSLKTRVNGETDHDEVEAVDNIIGETFAGFGWLRR